MDINWIELPHKIYGKNEYGKIIAEVTFPEKKPGICTIEDCFFDEDYRSLEDVDRLMERAYEMVKSRGEKLESDHPYGRKWLSEHEH